MYTDESEDRKGGESMIQKRLHKGNNLNLQEWVGFPERSILCRANNLNEMKAEKHITSWYSMRIASNLIW